MNRPPLLIATGNAHKFHEITAFLDGVPWALLSLRDFPSDDAPEEDGETFEANAFIKATAYCARHGVACVADDSGLSVDALDGAPGIYSARYAGPGCTDADNNTKVLGQLRGVADAERTARFICCAAFVSPDGVRHVAQGAVEGRIAREISGRNGFGYDPMFIPDGYDKSFGELDPAIKAAISHRAQAFKKMRAYLEAHVV